MAAIKVIMALAIKIFTITNDSYNSLQHTKDNNDGLPMNYGNT